MTAHRGNDKWLRASFAQHRDGPFDNAPNVRDASTSNGDRDACARPQIDGLPSRLRPNNVFDIFDPFAREFLTELVQFQGPHAQICSEFSHPAAYANSFCTTSPCTSVSRKSRP